MGWTYAHGKNRQYVIDELTKNWANDEVKAECLKYHVSGNVLWTLDRRTKTGQNPQVLIGCHLLDGSGWKSLCEGMHPYYYNCPLEYLEEAPVTCQKWRDLVYQHQYAAPTTYTPERLNTLNPSCSQIIDEGTAARINSGIAVFESGDVMRPGDIVLYHDPREGKTREARADDFDMYYGKRHENCRNICLAGRVYLRADGSVSITSGGPFEAIDPTRYKCVGRRPAYFWQFAQTPAGGAGVNFQAMARVWERIPQS